MVLSLNKFTSLTSKGCCEGLNSFSLAFFFFNKLLSNHKNHSFFFFFKSTNLSPFRLTEPEFTCFPCGSDGKESACRVGAWVQSLGWEDPLKKEKATHFSPLAWRIPWTEEPGSLQSMGVTKSWTRLSDSHTHTSECPGRGRTAFFSCISDGFYH